MKKKQTFKFQQACLKEIESKYKLLSYLMDHIPDIIYFKDKAGKLILVNKAHAKGLGLKPDEIIGKTDFDFFPRKRAESMMKDDLRVMKTGKPMIDKIERATRPDGIDNYVSTTKVPRYDHRGKIVGIIGITRDITKRKRFEELEQEKARIEKRLGMLEELNRLKSDFVSVVSHELRTPLAITKELVTAIFSEAAGPVNDKQKEATRRAMQNIERLEAIIGELLDISRIESEKLKLNYSLVNINELIKDSSDFFKRKAKEKAISLSYQLPKKDINLFMDADRVNQIISNLINNAIKFTEENGKIKVELKVFETKIRVAVIDTGIGIPKQDLTKLFDRFVQVSKKAEAERKGIGLGLSITKELVTRHGGEIWVESKTGVGSKFYFTLPRFYASGVLEKRIRLKIDKLLARGITVQFINLSIINFKEVREKIKIEPRKLFDDLKSITKATLKESAFFKSKESAKILTDTQRGTVNIILPSISHKQAGELSKKLKVKIKEHFIKNKIQEVFIALGLLSYSGKREPSKIKKSSIKVHAETYISSEMRRFKRVGCRAKIKIFLGKKRIENTHTLDISEGGICFVTKNSHVADSRVKIKLELPRIKGSINSFGRIAWIRKMDRVSGEAHDTYKIGLEFLNLKNKDRKSIIKELKL